MHHDRIKDGQMVHAIGGEAFDIEYDGVRGVHLGEVEGMEGNAFIKLKKNVPSTGGDHWFPMAWVQAVEGGIVYVNKTPEAFRAGLRDVRPEAVPSLRRPLPPAHRHSA